VAFIHCLLETVKFQRLAHPYHAIQKLYERTPDVSRLTALPFDFEFHPERCALLMIDMQRDFSEPGGFGEMLGNDVSQLRRTIEPNRSY